MTWLISRDEYLGWLGCGLASALKIRIGFALRERNGLFVNPSLANAPIL